MRLELRRNVMPFSWAVFGGLFAVALGVPGGVWLYRRRRTRPPSARGRG